MGAPLLSSYDPSVGPEVLADAWTLRKGRLIMRCALSTHELGWKLRLFIETRLSRVTVCRSEADVFEVIKDWRAQASIKGWT